MKIAFQGVRGANSEVGIRQHFGEAVEAVGYPFSEDVFEAVLCGECRLGYVPVENSIAGNVAINMDLLYRHDISVIAEDYVPIRHCLLARPGVKLEQIRRVYSHPVALEQCRPFLNQWGLTPVPDFDTAGAAAHLAERGSLDEAAIAPILCADYYRLELLSDEIQQLKTNITRFVVFCPQTLVPKDLNQEKTSLAFMARHAPGSLVTCLEQFGRHGLNMTRLESRPIPENPFAYIFFVDFLGSIADENVRHCLAEMSRSTQYIKILGSYPVGKLTVNS
ncbi:MAG: prephenate dehydratase [Candidatus Sericytochromatia bacterium]